MLVFIKKDTPEAAIRSLVIQLSRQGIGAARADSGGQILLALVGPTWTLDEQHLLALPHVADVKRLTPVWRLASRQHHPEDTVVSVGGVSIGGGSFCLMAGPCAIESAFQMQSVARSVKAAGAVMLRGGAYKPRTSPYSFSGLREEGLALLRAARRETGLPVVSEIMSATDLPLFEDVDILQVGARNMQNYDLLRALGRCRKPVLLKRGPAATVQELLLSAEYILSGGNENVILCERGIRTFSGGTRSTLDLSAVPLLHELTHLPVIVDPSHAVGRASLVPPMALAAAACGCDGLLIEVHNDPLHALCDGGQALLPEQFARLSRQVSAVRRSSEL